MQELVLIQPGRTLQEQTVREAERLDSHGEFEARLVGCGPLAYRVAQGVLHHKADAEDVAQEALLRAYRKFDRLRDRTRFRAWLVRIVHRLALDRLRSRKRRERRETSCAFPEVGPRRPRRRTWPLRRNSGLAWSTLWKNYPRSCDLCSCSQRCRATRSKKFRGSWGFRWVR